MARDQNTYAKRWREMDKKRKAEEKRARRRRKKEQANETDTLGEPEGARAIDEGIACFRLGPGAGDDCRMLERVVERAGRPSDGLGAFDCRLGAAVPIAAACPRTSFRGRGAQQLGRRGGQV